MSSLECILFLLIVCVSVEYSFQIKFKVNIIKTFTSLPGEDGDIPKTHVCNLELPARRERCSAASKISDCQDYGCKILLGTPGIPFAYEFEYVNSVDGEKKVKKWGVRCPSRPVLFITAGETDDEYEVMLLKQEGDILSPVFS